MVVISAAAGLALTALSSLIHDPYGGSVAVDVYGLPFTYLEQYYSIGCSSVQACIVVDYLAVTLDIVFWFEVSLLIAAIILRSGRKRTNNPR
jgi:hypothetical protein